MINRRICRVKTMQTLFAYYGDEAAQINVYEKKLNYSLDKIKELFIWQLSFLINIFEFERNRIEEAKNKYLPSEVDLNPNMRFIDNAVINKISENNEFRRKEENFHISWTDNTELIRSVLNSIKGSNLYIKYMNKADNDFAKDRTFIHKIFAEVIAESSPLMQFYEEKNIFWADDDYDNISYAIIKTLKAITPDFTADTPLPLSTKKAEEDEAEVKDFARELFRKTIINSNEFLPLIDNNTSNWEVERIAFIDIILCRMALTEFTQFSSIPIKATMNEYIEISKMYSTPKSSNFINGILDKLASQLENEGKIKKKGRGLIG